MAEYNPSKIIKDGNTYNFRDTTKIPLAGSNAISGDLIPATTDSVNLGSSAKEYLNAYIKSLTINGTACGDILTHNASEFVPVIGGAVMAPFTTIGCTDNTGYIRICGGVDRYTGAFIQINAKDVGGNKGYLFVTANDGTRTNAIHIRPDGDTLLDNCLVFYSSGDNVTALGNSGFRWKAIYAATGTINTSDSRLKNSVKDIDDKLLDAWGNIEPKQYKFNDATEKKGEKARYHTGYLAQDIQTECEKHGVNASDYGLFCYDEWEEQEEVSEEIETEKDGKKVKEKRVIQPKREKGDMYALRYEEALVVECKYLRRCIARLTARIEELESSK